MAGHYTDYDPQGTYGDPEPEALIYGVPESMWYGWSDFVQEKWLQDWNRTPEQMSYYQFTDKSDWYKLAYTYTTLIDVATGGASEEAYEQGKETYQDYKEQYETAKDYGKDILTAIVILGAITLLK